MRNFFTLVLICLLSIPCSAQANFHKLRNVQKTQNEPAIVDNTNISDDICEIEKSLALEPNSQTLLKKGGSLYFQKGDFPKAIELYTKLVEKYPTVENALSLSNAYMANQDFVYAQAILEPIYNATANKPQIEVINAYLDALLAQQNMRSVSQAYWVVKNNHLENTKRGYTVLGDMAMKDKDYKTARKNYENALELNPRSLILRNKLDQSSDMFKNVSIQNPYFNQDVERSPHNLETQLGFEYLDEEGNALEKSRVIFNNLLDIHPNYIPTKAGLMRSYIGASNDLSMLEKLKKMPQTDATKQLKAQIYYDMDMWTNAKEELQGVNTKGAQKLKYKIRRNEAITLVPCYSFFSQQLADEFDLDIQQFGTALSKNIDRNKNIFTEYNVYVYASGPINHLTNVTHEFIGGTTARPTEKWQYRADMGVKVFEFGGAMITTNSWIRHYFNDRFNMKIGFRRDNLEQSFLSAVGRPVDGILTGRAADNKSYVEFQGNLPHNYYLFGFGSYGAITAQNLPTNQYLEGMIGMGKLLYNNPKNPWVQSLGIDIVNYNTAYQYNLLKIYNKAGALFGGYFSPSYFNATTLNLKIEGYIKKWRLRYGIEGFGGIQTMMSPDSTTPAWGAAPYLAYDINDNITINVAYNHFVFADIQRDLFMVNAVIRGFNPRGKNKLN